MAGKMPPADSRRQTGLRAAMQQLETLAMAGVTHVRRPPAVPPAAVAPRTAAPPPPVPEPEPIDADAAVPAALDDRVAALARLEAKVAVCTRCPELAKTRKKTVFGSGNPHPRLVFMGEAPGADEDAQGLPFVGRAGQLLTDIIVKGMGLQRDEVYILNTLKCRPPGNRVPAPEEAANCREYLDGQLDLLRPEFLCCLGATAAQNLLGTTLSIGKMRGQLYDYRGIRVLCTYHPAYLLRNPAAKRETWDDIQRLMAHMGLTPNRT